MGNLRQLGDSGERPTELQTLKETYLLTPRGGFFDARNQNRDPEPSAKPLRESDKPTSPEILSFGSAQPGTSSKGTLGGARGGEGPPLTDCNFGRAQGKTYKAYSLTDTDSPPRIL